MLWNALEEAPISVPADDGTFESPSAATRPRFRYWLPDASVDVDVVTSDIEAAGKLGAGGIEFIPFYNYGGEEGGPPPGADWTKYGFGTPAYRDVFTTALKAHADNGLTMDFPLGPNQGQGVPAEWDDEGLQWNLQSFTTKVPANGTFEGVIPGWNNGQLVAFTSALVLSEQPRWEASTVATAPKNHTWTEFTLSQGSLKEHTSQVSSTGRVKLTFPRTKGNSYYRLFAFFQEMNHQKNLHFEPTEEGSIFSNGSLVVDHYSARGAQTVIEFWEKHFLTDEVTELIKQVGNCAWEDSVEILANITWTPSLPELFQKKHGYSINPFLPLLNFKQNSQFAQLQAFGDFNSLLDTPCKGVGYVNDYRSALEDGYNNYIDALRVWANDRLGVKYSNQPTYGLAHDMTAAIPHLDVPEYETFAFHEGIDGYRQFIGTAHLAGKRIISNELGASILKVFSLTVQELLTIVHGAVIGGTNQMILHGQPFSGNWHATTWPGYTPFQYIFGEMYSPKQPAWDHGFGAVIDYLARLQFVQRQGSPRTDVAVFNRVSRTNTSFPAIYQESDLEEAGYSYSYISPLGFDLPQAYVENHVLAPEGPAFKALVILSDQGLTVGDVAYLESYAAKGLPIILAGGLPSYRQTGNICAKRSFTSAIRKLQRLDNVYTVARGQVATKLSELNLLPQVSVKTSGVVYSTWREDSANGLSYAFIYNSQNVSISAAAEFASTGTPYTFDAWTGKNSSIFTFVQSEQTTTIPLQLEAGQTAIIAFDTKATQPSCQLTSLSSKVLGVTQAEGSSLSIQVPAQASAAEATLSKGQTVTLKAANPAQSPFQLSSWNLTAEHWDAPTDINEAKEVATKRNTTHTISRPTSWLDIPELRNVSGVGYYTTKFNWTTSPSTGAYLDFSTIAHTLQVYINNNAVEPFDHSGGKRDISAHLVDGQNKVLVVVPTIMWNYLISSVATEIRESGEAPNGVLYTLDSPAIHPKSDNGLVGNVTIVPYATVEVSC
ncbi:hypothetical protein BJX76DRAFT_368146 [Aspergillus varians]